MPRGIKDNPLYFPPQKVPSSKRTKKWYEDCVQAAEDLVAYGKDFEDHRKMQVWENLDNDIIDKQEIERVFNPMELDNIAFPASLKNYPLSVPKIDLLQGEEIKRKFDWNVIAKNEESHSFAAKSLRDDMLDLMFQQIIAEESNDETLQAKVKELEKYYRYDFKDINEISASRILNYLWREQNLKEKFSLGFRNALVKGREVYRIDIIGREPSVVGVDPKKVYFIRKPNDHRIENSDIIVEINYEPIGSIIDEFHEDLKPSQVADLETGYETLGSRETKGTLNHVNGFPLMLVGTEVGGNDSSSPVNQVVSYGLPYDSEGNVRVVRVRWTGRKKLGRVSYFDPITGDEQEKLVSENYEVDETLGETVKWFWVNEAMEGTNIANKYIVKTGPRKIQMRHIDNPSRCFLGYVGTDYGKSLMSRMEPYQYLYNVYHRRLELVISRYNGPIRKIDFAKKPAEWSAEMWMYFQEVIGVYAVDSFNEGNMGAAKGKLAGGLSNASSDDILDANPGNYIRELIGMLQYIENQMGEIAGVTKQRQGQIDNRETVGGVERAVAQSSHITERWFFIHDETKKRVMAALLDTAKQAWKNEQSKKISFVMDDMSKQMIDFNGEDFASTEYDLFITNSSEDMEIRQALKQLSQAAVQNGASLTLPITILRTDSITEMAKKIEEEENNRLEREQQAQQQQIESAERMKQAELQDKQAERDLKYYEIDVRAETDLQKEYIKLSGATQEVEDLGSDIMDQRKLDIQERKQKLDEKKVREELELKNKQLSETTRHNKVTEKISRQKPKSTSK